MVDHNDDSSTDDEAVSFEQFRRWAERLEAKDREQWRKYLGLPDAPRLSPRARLLLEGSRSVRPDELQTGFFGRRSPVDLSKIKKIRQRERNRANAQQPRGTRSGIKLALAELFKLKPHLLVADRAPVQEIQDLLIDPEIQEPAALDAMGIVGVDYDRDSERWRFEFENEPDRFSSYSLNTIKKEISTVRKLAKLAKERDTDSDRQAR